MPRGTASISAASSSKYVLLYKCRTHNTKSSYRVLEQTPAHLRLNQNEESGKHPVRLEMGLVFFTTD
jgi:hypothetical protein